VKVGVQTHTLTTLLLGEKPLVSIDLKAGWGFNQSGCLEEGRDLLLLLRLKTRYNSL
jgi:hypothetical protein